MNLNYTERGNNAFRTEEGSAVLFIKISNDGTYLQSSFMPLNYPAWNVNTNKFTEEELINHISYNLGDWYIDKCNFEGVNSHDGRVVDMYRLTSDVVEHIEKMADKYALDPNDSDEVLVAAVHNSAKILGYVLTERMIKSCIEVYHEEH